MVKCWFLDAADLTSSGFSEIVVAGVGGVGKATLPAEIAARVRDREPSRVLVSLTGPLTLESLLDPVIQAIRRELLIRDQDQDAAVVIRGLDVAARAELGWRDRLAMLRGHVLDRVLLDNFQDNLRHHRPAAAGGLHSHLQQLRRRMRPARPHYEHCRVCGQACRRCEQACRDLLGVLQ